MAPVTSSLLRFNNKKMLSLSLSLGQWGFYNPTNNDGVVETASIIVLIETPSSMGFVSLALTTCSLSLSLSTRRNK